MSDIDKQLGMVDPRMKTLRRVFLNALSYARKCTASEV